MWELETDGVHQEDLKWTAEFIRDEIEPLHSVLDNPLDLKDPVRNELIPSSTWPTLLMSSRARTRGCPLTLRQSTATELAATQT